MNTLRSRVARSPLLAGLVALLVGLFAFLLVVMAPEEPKWAYYLLGVKEKSRVLEYLGVGMGGVLLAIGAVIANRRAVAMEKAADAQATANRGAEDGRRQERLKNAIEHLGHESDSVRMGGAYELFHLAKDTEDLRQTVLDILCAHIRRMTGDDEYQEKHKSEPSTEIQSLLTLLFSREHVVFKGCSIDLQGSWLNGANLTRTRLQKARFLGAQLQGANLYKAQLQEANLTSTQLQRASLNEAKLQRATLDGTKLQSASLMRAQLQEANLYEAQLQSASLLWAQLQGANLYEAQLQEADLSEARLQGANLHAAQLQGANLSNGQLQGANLYKAQLQEADLSEARLQGANLHAAQLQRATLDGTKLQSARLLRAQLQGTNLYEAQLQGADLSETRLQGANLYEAQLQSASLLWAQLQAANLNEAQLQGAFLFSAQLQGATLNKAQLQGVTCQFFGQFVNYPPFKERIREMFGRESDLSGATFAGGLIREGVNSLIQGMPDEQAEQLRLILKSHIGRPASSELPEDSGAITGTYTKEEAERWIEGYEKAMRGVPKAGG